MFTAEEIGAVRDDITIFLMGDIAEARLHRSSRSFDASNPLSCDDKSVVGRMTSVWPDYATADSEVAVLADHARTIVEQNWSYIERVANELLKRDELNGRQVRLLRWRPLRMLVRFAG